MTELVRHVDAKFDSKHVRFRYVNNIFNQRTVQPYALFNRLATGTWTVQDMIDALGYSYMEGQSLGMHDVERLLNEKPPGNYVLLAQRIMEAYVVGIKPDLAVFDEDRPFE